jgi:hypothetical protein
LGGTLRHFRKTVEQITGETAVRYKCRGGVEQHRVPHRAGISGEQPSHRISIRRGVTTT